MSFPSSFDWPLLCSRFPLVTEQILSHLTWDDLHSCSQAVPALAAILRSRDVRRRIRGSVLRSSWLQNGTRMHAHALRSRFRHKKVDYWTFDRGEYFVILRNYTMQVFDDRGLRCERSIAFASDFQLSDCQEFFLSFSSDDLILLHVRLRPSIAFVLRRRDLDLVEARGAGEEGGRRPLLARVVEDRVVYVFEAEREGRGGRTLSVYEATNSLGEGDALGPRLRLNELAEFFPDCEDGGAEGIGKTTEAGGGHLARASDRGRMVLLSNLFDRPRRRVRRLNFFPDDDEEEEMEVDNDQTPPHLPSRRRRLECLRLGRRHLAASFSQGSECVVIVERDIDLPEEEEGKRRSRITLRLPGCFNLPDNVDGTCLSTPTDGLLVVSAPISPSLQRMHLVRLSSADARVDTSDVERGYVDMIHVVEGDGVVLFVCHRDPDLFDFGGTLHVMCAATGQHRALPNQMTMYSHMSDLPHHCLHVVSDSAFVLRPSISDDRLFLCSIKKLFSEEDEESSPELKFFEREETLEDGDSSKSKCQVM